MNLKFRDALMTSSQYSVCQRLAAGLLSASAVSLLAACGATAPTTSNAPSAAPAPAAQAPASPVANKTASGADTICKREVVIGSYFPIRVCKTAAEWERDSRGIERAQDDIARGVGSATPKQ